MGFPLFPADSPSLAHKHLTREMFNRLAGLKTGSGFTFSQAIRSGRRNPDSSIGIYAGDEESYSLFAELFDPVIHDYHKIKGPIQHIPGLTPVSPEVLDPDNDLILSTRIRVARNLDGFSFPAHIKADQRQRVESMIIRAVSSLPRQIKGKYTPFSTLKPKTFQALVEEKLAFGKGDRFMEEAGMNRDFPKARGVFLSQDKRFRIWVNEEDHLRIISMDKGPDIAGVYNRLTIGLSHLATCLGFANHPRYGALTSCPTNIGTAMRAGVHIRLEKLEKKPDLLKLIAARHHLQIRGTQGEKTRVDQSVFDISNTRRLGLSEHQIINLLHTGLAAIIQAEKNL